MIAAAVWLTSDRDALATTLTILGAGLVLLGAFSSRASGPVSLGPEGVKFVLGALVPRAAAKAVEKAEELGYPPEQVAAASAAAATTAAATAPAVFPELLAHPGARSMNLYWRVPSDLSTRWSFLHRRLAADIEPAYFDRLADEIATQAVDAINPARASEPGNVDPGTRS